MIIYLAGAETWWKKFLENRVRNILFSYFYMRDIRPRQLQAMVAGLIEERARRVAAKEPPMRLFLDSGAFTWLTHEGTKPPIRRYADDFFGFIESTSHVWDLIAELDVDSPSLGVATAEDLRVWRAQMRQVTRDQVPIVQVWHPFHGARYWEEMCADERSPYLALGSDTPDGIPAKLAVAHRYDKMVHGFAETKLATTAKYMKYDSVDSTTWLRSTKYGGFFVFQNNKLRVLDHLHKGERKLFSAYYKRNGIDMAKILAEDQGELTKSSLIAWRNLADRYELQGAQERQRKEAYERKYSRAGRTCDEAGGGSDNRRGADARGEDGSEGGADVAADAVTSAAYAGRVGVPRDASGEPTPAQPGEDAGTARGSERGGAGRQPGGGERDASGRRHHRQAGVVAESPGEAASESGRPRASSILAARLAARRARDAGVGGAAASPSGHGGGSPAGVRRPDLGLHREVRPGDRVDGDQLGDARADGGCADLRSSDVQVGRDDSGEGRSSRPNGVSLRIENGRLVPAPSRPVVVFAAPVDPDQDLVTEEPHSAGLWEGLVPHDPSTWDGPDGAPRCIPARNTGHTFRDTERNRVNEIGNRLGCAHCGASEPADPAGLGTWVKDHYPPTDDLPPCPGGHNTAEGYRECSDTTCPRHTARQLLIPSCYDCSLVQGGGRNKSRYAQPERLPGEPLPQERGSWRARAEVRRKGCQDDLHIGPIRGLICIACKQDLRLEAAPVPPPGIAPPAAQGAQDSVGAETPPPPTPQGDPALDLGATLGTLAPAESPGDLVTSVKKHLPVVSGAPNQAAQSTWGKNWHHTPEVASAVELVRSLPGVVCDTCSMSGECKEFREGAVCAFNEAFEALPMRDVASANALLEVIAETEKRRTLFAFMREGVTAGGELDPRVSQQSDRFLRILGQVQEARNTPPAPGVEFHASVRIPSGDKGSPAAQQAGGILSRIFGFNAVPSPQAPLENTPARGAVIDVPSPEDGPSGA
jgi:hypothetical protein